MRYFVVIPAAGNSTRMGVEMPKQYLPVHGKTILEHTLNCFLPDMRFEKVVVVLNQNDVHWQTLKLNNAKLITAIGGIERCHSVLNGLLVLADQAHDVDWVLVHDAARPCLQTKDIDKLINTLKDHPVGGLLGVPIRDTVKRVNNHNEITKTIERTALWQAFTPQMFRFGQLRDALQLAINNKQNITDEASAVELTGAKPVMVEGEGSNIKITTRSDLLLVENYLKVGCQK